MSYISLNGHTNGPIRIQNAWVGSYLDLGNTHDSDGSVKPFSYTTFSNNKLSIGTEQFLVPLLARTPVLGTYKDESGKVFTAANKNAVATVEWVVAYSSLSSGEMSGFDPDSFAKYEQIELIHNLIDNLDLKLSNVDDRVVKNTNDIQDIRENPFPDGLWLKCGGA